MKFLRKEFDSEISDIPKKDLIIIKISIIVGLVALFTEMVDFGNGWEMAMIGLSGLAAFIFS